MRTESFKVCFRLLHALIPEGSYLAHIKRCTDKERKIAIAYKYIISLSLRIFISLISLDQNLPTIMPRPVYGRDIKQCCDVFVRPSVYLTVGLCPMRCPHLNNGAFRGGSSTCSLGCQGAGVSKGRPVTRKMSVICTIMMQFLT